MTPISVSKSHNMNNGDVVSLTSGDERLWRWVVALILRLPRPMTTKTYKINVASDTTFPLKGDS